MAKNTLGRNIKFQIYNSDGTPFENLVLHKSTVESVVMSLGDKITGDVYYKNNHLEVTMREYIVYNDVKYTLVNPPTILREGLVKDNGDLKGMTKYSFEFYHPMYQLGNFPFSDVAVSSGQQRYLSENKKFSWIGYPDDYIAKLNKNLDGTEWVVEKTNRFPVLKDSQLSEVLSFDNNTVAEALKKFYETWEVPYVVSDVSPNESYYAQGKRFKVSFGLPSQEIYASESDRQLDRPFVFKMGQGVGLKNNSRTPSNNKIITRIAGYGSEDNIPYGYPQIPYEGIDVPYPLYDGIVGGRVVKLIKHPFTRTHLMPSIYRQTVKQKIYNQNVELKDYYDATGAPYTNLINQSAPCYEIHEFEDIKPEFGEEYIIDAQPINDSDKSVADEWDDTIDSDGNYNQGYFQITLPILSFDLYACAAITQEMQINMRGGACIGCTFTVQVDWDNYKENFYNQDGEFDPEGERRDYEKYPDSRQRSITVIVQKEYSTFGTIMPNVFQQPKNGDQFVFLGISMPSSYIEQAEQRLDDEMRSYMLENNTYHYEYPLKFDEYFLATHQYILEQLKPNSIVRFDFAGQELELFVKQTTIKYGESPLPQYNITLTDNIEIVLNQIGQVADDVEKLSSLVAILRQSYGRNVWVELSRKLSKVSDDTAQGFIRFMKGLQVGEDFVSGLLGEGGVFRKDADGSTYLEADKMYVRMKAYFDTVEIRKFLHSGGNRIASVAGAKCVRVVPFAIYNGSEVALSDDYRYHWTTVDPDTGEEIQHQSAQYSDNPEATNHVEYYRCYFRGSDGDDAVTNDFIIGDQAYCHITNGDTQALMQHHYWRLVLNKSNSTDADGMHYIDLSNHTEDTLVIEGAEYKHAGFQTGSDVPLAQDDIVQLGNIADKTRQGAIIEYVSGEDSPSYQIYQGIDDFSLSGKNYIGIGYNSSTGRAYMNVYGDAYIGDRNRNAYMQYHIVNVPVIDPETGEQVIDEETGKPVYRQEPRLDIKARISVQSTVSDAEGGDQTFEEYINSRSVSKETIMKLIGDDLQAIQNQIDGAIETWFYNGAPSANTIPESEWKATDTEVGNNNERLKHLGDLYYDNKTGRAYRYVNTGTEQAPVFSWTEINDSAVVEALKKAQDAQSTADGKRRVFVAQPTPPYDKGDLWVNATFDNGTIKYDDDILKCVTAKDKNGSFAIADWALASKYTDDSSLNTFLNGQYKTDLQATRNQIDGKAETWYQSQDPSTAWTTDKLQESHVGDLWYNTTNKKTFIYRDMGASANPRYKWAEAEMDVPQEVFDKIDGKTSIYTNTLQNPPTNYKENDLWIIPADYNINGVEYKNGEVLTAIADSVGFNQAHWTKKVRYTDDTKFDGYINQILRGTGASGDSATVANAIKVIKNALNEATVIDGGLVLTSLINLRSNSKTWAGISGQYNEKEETQGGAKGHGIAAWYGGGMADWEKYKESHPTATITDDYAKSLFRFDGSGYLAGGNITWDALGRVAIKDITTLIGNSDTDILNGLTIFNKAFHFNTQQGDDVTVLSINPQAGFTNLSITSGGVLYPVATQQWVSDNYLSKAFFSRLFQAHNGAADVNPNDTTTAITDIEAMFGFWTEQYISALGKNDSSSDVVLNEPLLSINNGVYGTKAAGTAIVWDGSKWVYGKTGGEGTVTAIKVGSTTYSPTNGVVSLPAYPTSLAWGNITGKPTTLGDYGITDAKIENGVITLGANTITPLTDAKLKSGYEWWGQKLDASGKVNGNITIQLTTVDTNTYADANPKLIFKNANGSQNISLTFTDYDSVAYPASLTLNGNQGNELFIAPRMKADRLYLYKPNGGYDTNAVYLEYDSANGGVHLVGAGLYSDSYVSALGLSDSGSSSVFDEDAMWTALGTNRTNKLIASAYLGNVTKTLTIKDGNGTTLGTYNGTAAQTITVLSGNYLPLSGGTLTGNLTVGNTTIYASGSNGGLNSMLIGDDAYIGDCNHGGHLGIKSANGTTAGFYFYGKDNAQSSPIGYFTADNNVAKWNGNTMWHAGNDGANSGLDADLLDGQHGSYYGKASDVTTLQGYFTGGVANSAAKLSTVSKTLWGNTYWTAGGVPTDVGTASSPASLSNVVNITMSGSIGYKGTKATYQMFKFKDNTNDTYGNGVVIGGGGLVAIGGGESADVMAEQHAGGDENLMLGNDGAVDVYTNLQSGWASRKSFSFDTSGNFTLEGHVRLDNYKHIEIKNTSGTYLNVLTFTSANQFVLGEGLQSYPTYLRGNTLTLQTGTSNAAALTINASGLVEVNQNTQGLKIGNAYLVWDSANNALKVTGANSAAINFYATGGVSALGIGDGSGSGGGVTLNEPLASINSSSLGSPSGHTNSTLVYNGSSWVWSNSQGVSLGAYNFSAFAGNFNTLAINNKAVATQEWVTNTFGFTSLTTSGTNISATIAGTTKTVQAPTISFLGRHAETESSSATPSAKMAGTYFGTSTGLYLTETYNDGNTPATYGNILNIIGTGGGQLLAEWCGSYATGHLYYRSHRDNLGSGGWSPWVTILDSGNTYISGQTITINGTSLTVPTGAGGDYLPLSGGTLTGILNLNFQSINASETNNGISQAHVYPTTFNICDRYGKILTRMEADVESAGDISSYWYVRNYNTSGGQIGQKGIRMRLTKGGVFSYTVDEPDKFREAIGVSGDYIPLSGSSSITGSLVPVSTDNYNLGTQAKRWSNIYTSYLHTYSDFYLDGNDDSHIYANDLKIYSGYSMQLYCTDRDNPITFGTSTYNQGILSYGGFKKSGSSDSYVLLGGGGHKALSDFVRVHSALISGNIYSVPCGTIFSGINIADAPTTGWVSGIALGSNLNSNHYQSYLVESNNGNWYVTRSYQNGAMTNWKTLLDSNNYMQYTSAISNSANAGGGSAGWIRVAILKLGSSYHSQPIFMRVVQRGGNDGELKINFSNQGTSDPTIKSFTYTGTLKTVKLIRYSASTWHLYIQKSENHDAISVSVRDMTPYMQARVTVTYDNVFSSSEPTGTDFSNGSSGNWYAACEEFFSNGDGTMKIYGVSSGYGDERIAIQTSFDGQDPKISTYPSSYPTRACLLLQPRGGNVGIGTTSPSVKLDVNGVVRATELQLSHGFYLDWDNSNSNAYSIGDDGKDIYAEGDWYGRWVSSSDIRLKDIDQYLDGKLEDIALAPIFSFRWKDKPNKPLELGTSAQYWKVHLPYGVTQTHSGYLALDYGATALAAAVFTARKVVDHELRIKQLQDRVLELENEIKQLKAA